jgi:hypothetical protein
VQVLMQCNMNYDIRLLKHLIQRYTIKNNKLNDHERPGPRLAKAADVLQRTRLVSA